MPCWHRGRMRARHPAPSPQATRGRAAPARRRVPSRRDTPPPSSRGIGRAPPPHHAARSRSAPAHHEPHGSGRRPRHSPFRSATPPAGQRLTRVLAPQIPPTSYAAGQVSCTRAICATSMRARRDVHALRLHGHAPASAPERPRRQGPITRIRDPRRTSRSRSAADARRDLDDAAATRVERSPSSGNA